MPAFRDISGQRFGKLVAKTNSVATFGASRRTVWLCECDCGNVTTAISCNLTLGRTKSCGCSQFQKKKDNPNRSSSIYATWCGVIQRCKNPNSPSYPNYGGRGITVCDLWAKSFHQFAADVGEKPGPEYTIDRIDNGRGYEPGNVRWATRTQQGGNKRNNRLLTLGETTLTLSEWARRTGINSSLIHDRIFKRKWSVQDALTKAPRPIKRRLQKPESR